jgi:hypothetical protein
MPNRDTPFLDHLDPPRYRFVPETGSMDCEDDGPWLYAPEVEQALADAAVQGVDPIRVALGRAWVAQVNSAWRQRREALDEAIHLWTQEAMMGTGEEGYSDTSPKSPAEGPSASDQPTLAAIPGKPAQPPENEEDGAFPGWLVAPPVVLEEPPC